MNETGAAQLVAPGDDGRANAQIECIKAFSETDFTEDLRSIDVPVLILHGEDDQIVPVANSALLTAELVKHGTLKVYPGLPHGMCDDARRPHQRRPARLHQSLIPFNQRISRRYAK